MLLGKDKKRMAMAIVSSTKPDGTEGRESKPKSDRSVAKSSAMSGFLSALDRKDTEGMASSLGTFWDLHSSNDDEEGEKEEYSSGDEGGPSEVGKDSTSINKKLYS